MKKDLGLCDKCSHLKSIVLQADTRLERYAKCSQGFFDLSRAASREKIVKCSEFCKCKDQVTITKWDEMTWYIDRTGQIRNYMTSSLEDALSQCEELFKNDKARTKTPSYKNSLEPFY